MYTLSELYTYAATSFSADNTSDIVDSAAAMLEIAEKSCFTMPDGGR